MSTLADNRKVETNEVTYNLKNKLRPVFEYVNLH